MSKSERAFAFQARAKGDGRHFFGRALVSKIQRALNFQQERYCRSDLIAA